MRLPFLYWLFTLFLKFKTKPLQANIGIFPSTFLRPVNGSKNSILNWIMKLSHVFFLFLVVEISLRDFPLYLPIILTLWFRYLQTCINKNCMFLVNFSSKLSLKPWNYKIPRKILEKCIFQWFADVNLKNFPFSVCHGAIPQSH